ncbi:MULTISPECIES: protein kinase family protein [Bacillaceae]|nr:MULTISPECIES: protein kinase family protein [Bacillaceae]RQW22608.1 protein kinase family protein [Bacillus sp. C1-1]
MMPSSITLYETYAKTIVFQKNKSKYHVKAHHPDLTICGIGRSATAFKLKEEPLVLKVFYPPYETIAEQEQHNYRKVKESSYYPTLYESGSNYLVIDYIDGRTFFQCLEEGIPILPDYVHQVDQALSYAKRQGLNPSDIHLHNLLVTKENRVHIIDIARFSQTKPCYQWNDLKAGYYKHYHRAYFPSKVPRWMMNLVASIYRATQQ